MGGREGDETPQECAIREMKEEFGVTLSPDSFVWEKAYPSPRTEGRMNYFLVAHISSEDIANISFGDEGQRWECMDYDIFLVKMTSFMT